MLAWCGGDAGAFERLYGRHKGPLYRYMLRQLNDASIAEELFQDVWLKIVRASKTYKVRASFRTFLYHVAHNRLADHYRRTGRTPASEPYDDSLGKAGQAWEPDRRADGQRAVQVLLEQIAGLPELQREAFLLKEEGGLTLEEIATVTNVNRETAKSRLRYAIRRLRNGIGEAP